MAKNAKKPASARKGSARRPAKSGNKRNTRSGARRWFSWRFIAKVSVVLLVLAAAGLAYLDAYVRDRFDSHVWQLPARVYARPVELYPGRVLARNDMLKMMELMRYRRAGGAPTPGSYTTDGNTLLIHTRGFRDSDGGEPAQRIRVTLGGGRVTALSSNDGDSLARLEPLQIGSIHPGHTEDRVFVPLDRVPPLLVQMLLATEDRDFYEHHGVSPRGLARAMVANVKAGGLVQGGSTLTQQLVKNFWLTQDRTLARKLVEMPMAVLLELHYSKEQILEAYLNEVYLGQDGKRAIHGMGLGAQFYFGRPLEELEPHQLATLVALLKGPSYYDPRRNPERSLARRNTVLKVALEEGALSDQEYRRFRERDLEVVPRGASPLYAFPAFIDLVRRQLARDYPADVLGEEGLRIHSTLDVLAQLASEKALSEHLNSIDASGDALNGAVVVVAPAQGDVLALVGSRESRAQGFNRALDATRPMGSLVKPVVMLTALQQPKRYSLATPVADEPITVPLTTGKKWTPQNFDGESKGPIPLVDALAYSRNQATVRLGMDVGPDAVVRTLSQLGVKKTIPAYPSILLGSIGMTPFEVAMLYQPLATGGFATPLRSITDVLDKEGEPLARYPVDTEEVIESGPAYLIQWGMQQVVEKGTARSARSVLPADLKVAGKTGTSDEYRDAWFAGFSGNHLSVVWVGRDNNENARVTGSSGALPIWSRLMAGLPQTSLSQTPPPGVEEVWMDPSGQKTSGKGCSGAREYPMLEASIPEQSDGCGSATQVKEGVVEWFKGWFD